MNSTAKVHKIETKLIHDIGIIQMLSTWRSAEKGQKLEKLTIKILRESKAFIAISTSLILKNKSKNESSPAPDYLY